MPEKSGPKDVFLHLLTIVTLYISAGSLITVLFQYINYFLPDDPLNSFVNREGLRWAVASLFVVFPVYALVSRYIERDCVVNPAKRDGRLRKWLLYFTLFIAAITLIGDLVFLIYTFLGGGDLTLRFILKALSIGTVTSGIFGYYLWELRRDNEAMSARAVQALRGGVLLVALIFVGAFFIVGSPFKERMVRLDSQRINDLNNIQWQVINYWQTKETLPSALTDLKDSLSGFEAPLDPETKTAYEYRATGALSFELCATFGLPSQSQEAGYAVTGPYNGEFDSWNHAAGRICFERNMDPDRYQPFEKTDRPTPKPAPIQ